MEDLDEKNLSRVARRKMAQRARRTAKKRAVKRKARAKRMKTRDQLKSSAEKMAKNLIVKKLTGGKKYGELSIGQKETVDKKISAKKGLVQKIARRMLPKVKSKEKDRLKKVRGNDKEKEMEKDPVNEIVDPLTIASVVAITGGAVAITATLAKKLSSAFSRRSVDFKVEKTYELIKKKYPPIFAMIRDQRFGKGKLAKMVKDMQDEIPGLKKRTFMNNITDVIEQLMQHHNWVVVGDQSAELDPDRFQREQTEGSFGVLTLKVDGSYPEVSAREVGGKLKAYTFKTGAEAKKHTELVGGKVYQPTGSKLYYVEFTKLDGPADSIDESKDYKTANEIKKEWKKQYPKDKFTFKKVRGGGNDWLLVISPKGVELERYQHVPKTGWIEMNESKDNEETEDIKSLQAILDVASVLSPKSPYFKGRGSKDKYIKMIKSKLDKLGVHENIDVPIAIGDTVLGGKFKNKKIVVKSIGKNEKGDLTINGRPLLKYRIIRQKGQMFKEGSKKNKNKPTTRMDAYKKVRKSTMPKSRPMKSKKTYDRKKFRKGEDD
jgi:hypothetical protein